ncbi:hypothetical protein CEXT_392811 [Caerostris extrusa]|uniref:Uncharacterized protein n=1 Tax=Caerostris extrusa TaxID=172846 RepID=A0AAV4MTG4_CAEEX|nr:hypothetical protein CEXT_392811 [Caerostris extrusa]
MSSRRKRILRHKCHFQLITERIYGPMRLFYRRIRYGQEVTLELCDAWYSRSGRNTASSVAMSEREFLWTLRYSLNSQERDFLFVMAGCNGSV